MASLTTQTWAISRKYVVSAIRSPFKTAIRAIILPGLILGLCIYLAIEFNKNEEVRDRAKPANTIPYITLFMTFFSINHFVEWIVIDKTTGVKSLMLLMGLKRSSYYIGTSIAIIVTILPFVLALCIASLVYVFNDSKSSAMAIILIYVLFVIHLTGVIFVIASFITSTNYVSLIYIVLLFEPQIHTLFIWLMGKSQESWWPVVLFLASFSPFESLRIFSNSYTLCKNCDTTRFENDLVSQPAHLILIAMTIWTIASFAFVRWFEEVYCLQTDSEVKSPFFCCEKKSNNTLKLDDVNDMTTTERSKFFEQSIQNGEIGIRITNLTKSYRSIPVVDSVTFNIYRGETTLLLGHNGAGKTTMMNMILGNLLPDKGKVIFPDLGRNNKQEHCVGVCPQTSILDASLSVRQHLELFVDIKTSSMSSFEREHHISQTIEDVSLTNHQYKLPSELSGGMKRKLSLALAFVGRSSILILDEPSSGLDPDSRVFIWNAIRRYRADRTVLLSTQHMEEADYLGDRIAIMSAGKIVCCGSSTFLNNTFGTGYKLRVECLMSKRKEVLAFVRKYFKLAKLAESDQLETPQRSSSRSSDPTVDLVIELKVEDKSIEWEQNLIRLLEEIETRSDALHIKSHSLKSSSIEDVMLNTSKSFLPTETGHSIDIHTSESVRNSLINPKFAPSSSAVATQRTFLRALMIKHAQTYRRNITNTIFYRIIAVIAGAYLLVNDFNPLKLTHSPNLSIVLMTMHFIYMPSLEQTTNFKTVQLASELKFVTYWLSQLLADMVTIGIQVIAVVVFMLTVLSGEYVVSKFEVISIASLGVILFGISSAMIAYILSTMVNESKKAMGYYFFLFTISVIEHLFFMFMSFISSKDLSPLTNALDYILIAVFPHDAIIYVYLGFGKKCYIKSPFMEECVPSDTFSPVTFGLIALVGQVIVYSTILYVIERENYELSWYFRWRNWLCCGGKRSNIFREERDIDEDVVDESIRAMRVIGNVPPESYSLVAADLTKSYIKTTKVIDHLSFTVGKGECFGLLGVNGAGKSTTFSMVAAQIKPDAGKIWMTGNYLSSDIDTYRRHLGYDPQPNPDILLTTADALYLMARLRRVHERSIPQLVNSLVDLLEMAEHTNKVISTLSGGTKRKLGLGMSLIGTPPLLALDEPTAGVDPMARRSVWELLRSLRKQSGSSIMISSHAMEECEAICDRIGIMARGRLRCIGSFLHLRSKFSQGCTIKVQSSNSIQGGNQETSSAAVLKKETVLYLNQKLHQVANGKVKLTDTNVNSATFNITDNKIQRSRLFQVLREFKNKYPTVSYTVNDSSLEDIFIALAREEQQLEQQQAA